MMRAQYDAATVTGAVPPSAVRYSALFYAADVAANAHHGRHLHVLRTNLLLIIVAGLLTACSPVLPSTTWWLWAATALVLAMGIVVQAIDRWRRHDRNWSQYRALAEAIKGETWRYVMSVSPYDGNATVAEARMVANQQRFLDRYRVSAAVLGAKSADAPPVTPEMRALRDAPLPARRSQYLQGRTTDQIRWYAAKGTHNCRVARWLFWLGQGAQGAAVMCALWRIAHTAPLDIVPFLTALTAVGAAWIGSGRHEELAESYRGTARELARWQDRLIAAVDETAFGAAALGAEETIMQEWMTWATKRQ